MTGLFEVMLFSGVLLAFVTWIVTVLFAPSTLDGTASPRSRTFRIRLWLYASLWVPVTILLASLMPGIIGEITRTGDHCLTNGHHYHHLCLVHPPHFSGQILVWFAILTLLVSVLATVALAARDLHRDWRLTRTLVWTSLASEEGDDIRLIERDGALACTVGIFRPVILLSTGLIDQVCERTLAIIVAHERAHIARRDMAWAVLDRLAGSLLPKDLRSALLYELGLAQEQACDMAASKKEGKLHVAAALTEIARLSLSRPALAMSAGASSLAARVHYLLDEPSASRLWPLWPLATVLIVFMAGAGPIHHLLEYLATLLLH